MKGFVHSLESFGSVDGPGIRYVIFLTGCNMRCQFCHNPDTWDMKRGTEWDSDELLKKAIRFKSYWGKNGGITVSGGEPLLQIDFLIDLFKKAHDMGISTCLDTSAQPFTKEEPFFTKFKELMKYTDIVLLDIKNIFDKEHRILTGHTNTNILECAKYLSDTGVKMWIRHVLVPGGSDNDEQLNALSEFISTLRTVERVEVLPYHVFGVHKWELLGIKYPLDGVNPPTTDRIENAEKILNHGLK